MLKFCVLFLSTRSTVESGQLRIGVTNGIVSSTWLCRAVKEAPCAKGYLKDFEVNLLFQIKWSDLPIWLTHFGFS
jgi:hypothetical protein